MLPHAVLCPAVLCCAVLLHAGWWHVNVTSTPAKIQDAMLASLNVLRNLYAQPITQVGG